jgi:hypothetical protein
MILIEMLKTFILLPVWALIWAWQSIKGRPGAAEEAAVAESPVLVASVANPMPRARRTVVRRDLAA